MSDPLAIWWTHPVTFYPNTGVTFDGPTLGAGVVEMCRVVDETRMVRDSSGDETVSTARLSYSAARPVYLADTEVDMGDGRRRRVISSATHSGGNGLTPDYNHAYLE